jgi:hypothetical protein
MKTPLLAILLLGCSVAHARLTEKEDELIKRFGPVRGKAESHRSFQGRRYVVGTDLRFQSDQWRIAALLIDGRCAQINYSKVGDWTEEQIIGLLDRNGGSAMYQKSGTGLGKSHRTWKRADGVTAVFSLGQLTLTHPLYERRLEVLKAKAEAESKAAPKF